MARRPETLAGVLIHTQAPSLSPPDGATMIPSPASPPVPS
jgi:hypothetical protein